MKIRLVVILASAMFAYSGRSFAHTRQPAAVKLQLQADSAASQAKLSTQAAPGASGISQDISQDSDNETVIVALPFSFLELDSSLAEYLSLTPRQIREIQHLISQQHRELEPLQSQLRLTQGKLLAAADRAQAKEIELLADMEARILTKLVIKSSRILARFYDLLTPAQQKKLEDLNVVLKER